MLCLAFAILEMSCNRPPFLLLCVFLELQSLNLALVLTITICKLQLVQPSVSMIENCEQFRISMIDEELIMLSLYSIEKGNSLKSVSYLAVNPNSLFTKSRNSSSVFSSSIQSSLIRFSAGAHFVADIVEAFLLRVRDG